MVHQDMMSCKLLSVKEKQVADRMLSSRKYLDESFFSNEPNATTNIKQEENTDNAAFQLMK